jgi:hypothetical protein
VKDRQQVRAQIQNQIIIHQGTGAQAQVFAAGGERTRAIFAFAKKRRIPVGGGASQKKKSHGLI